MSWSFFYDIPISMAPMVVVVLLFVALEIGYRTGLRQRAVWKDADSGGGNVVLQSMFLVLGLILAFPYGAGVSRNEARKHAVIAEANALGTAFLRAGLVAEPGRGKLTRELLAESQVLKREARSILRERAGEAQQVQGEVHSAG